MRRILETTLLCSLTLMMTGCMKETGETILLPIKNKSVPVTVLSEERQKELSEFFPIYEGDTPPDISGVYIVSPMQLSYASDGYNNDFFDMRWQVSPLDMLNRTTYSEWQGTASGSAIEANLIGENDRFTMYTVAHVTNGTENWNCDLVTLVSGKKTAEGIADYHYAIIMQNKRDEYNQLIDTDCYRIFTDGDGLSSVISAK